MGSETLHRPHRPLFGKLPPSAVARWRLVTEFIATWYPELQPGDGYSSAELDAAQEKLGYRFPGAVRDWYQLAGRRSDVWCHTLGMYFVEPWAAPVLGEYLILLMDDFEGTIAWGVHLQDLEQDDPPIWALPDQDFVKEGDPPTFQCTPTTTGFAIAHMLFEMTIEKRNSPHILASCQGNWLEYASRYFRHCDLSPHCLHDQRQGWQFWEGVDIVATTGENSISVVARTEEAFAGLHPSLRAHRRSGSR
jgi:hypothetical protein